MSINHKNIFAETRKLLKEIPAADLARQKAAKQRWDSRTKPINSLGKMEAWIEHLAAWQKSGPSVSHPRVAIFAGNHGIAKQGVSAYPSSVTQQMVANMQNDGAAINQIARLGNCDLQVYEMALELPTNDISTDPAMSSEDCHKALCYGMMAVDDTIDILCLGEMGIGNTTSAAAVAYALFGGQASDWVGKGTGINSSTLAKKSKLVEQAVKRIIKNPTNPASPNAKLPITPFEILAQLGGRELAAICGAILAARQAGCVVILDGFVSCCAAAVLYKEQATALDHCLISHLSKEAGHQRLCQMLGMKPQINLDMALGEASGAALLMLLLRAAHSCWENMAGFEDGVDTATITS